MEQSSWIDITSELKQVSKGLGLLQTVTHTGYTLQDSMQAHEINDSKIDPKFDISPKYTLSYGLQNKSIKHPSELNYKEIRIIYKNILKMQAQVLSGLPLSQTIYTFAYLYDKSICMNTPSILALVESINILGSFTYQMVKQSCSLKEDDIGMSSFSYNKNRISNSEVIQLFVKVEKNIEAAMKINKQDQFQMNQLLIYIRIRRFLHLFIQGGKKYQQKNVAKIQNDIASLRKKISLLEEIILKDDDHQTVEGAFSNTLNKTLRSHFSPRNVPSINLQNAINILKDTFDQIEIFFPLPTKISQWRDKLQLLQKHPLNLWAKSWVKINMVSQEGFLFNTIKVEDTVIDDMNDWVHLKESTLKDQKFKQLIHQSSGVINQTLYRLLGNSMRWQWECSKIYDDLNYVIYLGTEYDGQALDKKELYVCSWFYYYALSLMAKQILVGFEIKLYEEYEYSYVLARLQGILNVYDKNSQFFLKKMDKIYISSFIEGTLAHKKKKKIESNVRKIFTDIQFKKALYFYVRSLHRIIVILMSKGHLKDPFASQAELRINNRFRIFKNIQFIRKMDYQEYIKTYNFISNDPKASLDESFEMLKEAKNLFQLISNLQQNDAFVNQRQDSVHLTKICVQTSLIIMSLRMNQPKKYKLTATNPKYPQIVFG